MVAVQSDGDGATDTQPIIKEDDRERRSSGDTTHCPTCQGTGRIQAGKENKLVAVIPCNDQRLKPRHTACYVALSVSICAVGVALVLAFLFPRSVLLSPVAVTSSFIHITNNTVQINITNVVNITNSNFVEVQAYNLTVQAFDFHTQVGSVFIKNVASVSPLSVTMYSFELPITLTDEGKSDYCRNPSYTVRVLFLHLQMSMTVYSLAHYEQLYLETYEYIDCGANSTIPHSVHPYPADGGIDE